MYKLLFVDDEALIREGISENICWESLGYELAGVCENGREAVSFLESNQVDVVLTDICMPFMDGMELSAYIRREQPHVKVLILSGYDDFAYAKKAIKYGVEEYILKPITSFELREVLTELKQKMDKEDALREKQKEIYSAYRKGQLLLRSEALWHTITGTKTEEECALERQNAGIHLSCSCYLAAAAALSVYTEECRPSDKSRKEQSLMSFIVYNLCSEIMEKYKGGEVCQGKDNRVFLLFTAEDVSQAEEKIQQICSEIIAQVNRNMGMGITIALGSWQTSLGNVYQSYEQAERALKQNYAAGDNRVIDSRNRKPAKTTEAALEDIGDNLVRHVRECSLEKLELDIDRIREILCESCYQKPEAVEALLEMKQKTDKLLHTLKVDRPSEKAEEEIRQSASAKEALEVLLCYVKDQARELDSVAGAGASVSYLAYEYIESHYGESSLSLQEVCRHLGVSTTRFSSAFKQTFGKTFMDVLIGIRMEKARELLAMTELKNYEIAEKVGFGDPHYFSIAFKKATGMTPTEYARERRQ